jgi:anti-anti-sigma regulatory factor
VLDRLGERGWSALDRPGALLKRRPHPNDDRGVQSASAIPARGFVFFEWIRDRVLLVTLSGQLDHASGPTLSAALHGFLSNKSEASTLLWDLEELASWDSASRGDVARMLLVHRARIAAQHFFVSGPQLRTELQMLSIVLRGMKVHAERREFEAARAASLRSVVPIRN